MKRKNRDVEGIGDAIAAQMKEDPRGFHPWFELPEVNTFEEVMEFDRSICDSGCKQFLRRFSVQEIEQHPIEYREEARLFTAVLVAEIKPGVRTRRPIRAERLLNLH